MGADAELRHHPGAEARLPPAGPAFIPEGRATGSAGPAQAALARLVAPPTPPGPAPVSARDLLTPPPPLWPRPAPASARESLTPPPPPAAHFRLPVAKAAAGALPVPRGPGFQPGSPGPRAMELRAADQEQPAGPNLPARLALGWGRERWKRAEGRKSSCLSPGLCMPRG